MSEISPTTIYIALGVIFIIVFILIVHTRAIEMSSLQGCWVADSTFCEQAGLDRMIMYIGGRGPKGHQIYILAINSDGNIIINSAGTMSLEGGTCLRPWISPQRKFTTKFIFADGQQYQHFPADETIEYNPEKMKISIVDRDHTVRAILYKDHSLSDIKSQLEPRTVQK